MFIYGHMHHFQVLMQNCVPVPSKSVNTKWQIFKINILEKRCWESKVERTEQVKQPKNGKTKFLSCVRNDEDDKLMTRNKQKATLENR